MQRQYVTHIGVCAVLVSALSACAPESRTGPENEAPPFVSQSSAVDRSDVAVASKQAERLALALRDSSFRRTLLSELQSSKLAEGKISWSGLLARKGVALRQAVGRQDRNLVDDFSTEGNSTLALYLPIRSQRKAWKGEGDVLVALQIRTGDPIVAYSTNGESRFLSEEAPPAEVVIAIVPAEVGRATLERENVRLTSGAVRLDVGLSSLEACENMEECPGEGGGGAPQQSYPPGIYATQMTVWDKAEPWIRGDPEIELVLLGTVSGRYYTTAWPSPAAPDLAFLSGEFLVPIGCAGRLAPSTHGGVKQFDYNSEGGVVYSQTVLIEERDEFGVEESVKGAYGTVLYSREVAPHAPFVVQAWERDDGGECPTPAEPWFPSFNWGFNFNTRPTASRLLGLQATNSSANWLAFLGITNENDALGAWSFSSWDAFEAMSPTTLRTGSHVDVRLSNTGVNRYNLPVF